MSRRQSPSVEPKLEDLDDARPPPETPSVMTEPSPPPLLKREKSSSSTPTPAPPNGKLKRTGPQLIGDLPLAEEAARATFVELTENHYQYNTLGRSREALESMTCDCAYEHGVDDPLDACGQGSDCINRLTQVECLLDDCRCRSHCQNQRFQRKEYANIDIVLTEKKGYGLRAASDLAKDAFIYEYIGDVVSHPSFMKRMREYAEEGIKHFYFMMLQNNEYIDATKRGGIGRFANHSCSPNCYVAKWQVGERIRMGIFAKRSIKKNEELTFNYNVDRYGHEPQLCFCGEQNCVGYLGGKTQTEIGGMDDLYLDALGIIDEVEKLGLKGNKKKKSKKLDEDYMPELKPLVEKDIPKVVQAIRQTSSKKFLTKLLTRIRITENEAALRQIMRLRGFSLMTNILQDYVKDVEVTILALEAMIKWPLIQRNKVDDSKIRIPVQACAESENEGMKSLALKLLEYWDSLEVAYRIPKRLKANGEEETTEVLSTIIMHSHEDDRPLKKTRLEEDRPFILRPASPKARNPMPYVPAYPPRQPEPDRVLEKKAKNREIADVIAAANAAAEAETARLAAAAAAVAAATVVEPVVVDVVKKKSKPTKKPQTKEEVESAKEKRLLKLVGAVVVKCMSKYSGKMDTDVFKQYAKELTHVIADKEKKSSSYRQGRLDALSDEKVAKIKKFSKEYISKVLRKLEKSKSKQGPRPSSSHSKGGGEPSSSTLRDGDGEGEAEMGDGDEAECEDVEMIMSVEQAMDLGSDSEDGDPNHEREHELEHEHDQDRRRLDHPRHDGQGQGQGRRQAPNGVHDHDGGGDADADADAEMDTHHSHSSDEADHDPSPMEGVSSHVHPRASSVSVTPMTPPPPPPLSHSHSPSQSQSQTVDPRLKHPHRSEETGWDPDGIRVANAVNEVHA